MTLVYLLDHRNPRLILMKNFKQYREDVDYAINHHHGAYVLVYYDLRGTITQAITTFSTREYARAQAWSYLNTLGALTRAEAHKIMGWPL